MTTSSDSGHVLVVQVSDSRPEIHRDMAVDDCIDAVARADEGLADRLRLEERKLVAVREEIATDPDMAVEYFLLQRAQSQADDLLSCDLEDYSSDEQNRRVEQYHRYSRSASALLYRDVNFRGGSKFFTITWPNFKWSPYKFNDTASSVKSWGVGILFEHTWYRGRRFYMAGIPYVQFPDLREFEFNDIASSFVSVP